MANMARKNGVGDYQIGQWAVLRFGRSWIASAPGIRDTIQRSFPSLRAAHRELTGEDMHGDMTHATTGAQ
jgi:hypothetical protein